MFKPSPRTYSVGKERVVSGEPELEFDIYCPLIPCLQRWRNASAPKFTATLVKLGSYNANPIQNSSRCSPTIHGKRVSTLCL